MSQCRSEKGEPSTIYYRCKLDTGHEGDHEYFAPQDEDLVWKDRNTLLAENKALQVIVDAAVDLIKWCGAGALKTERYDRLFSLAGTYHLRQEGKLANTRCAMCQKGEAMGSGLCKDCADRIMCSHDPRKCPRCKQMAEERRNFGE